MHILLFFTFDFSLKQWFDKGYACREILLYKKFLKDNHQVTFFTYGDNSDFDYSTSLEEIIVVPVYNKIEKHSKLLKRFMIAINAVKQHKHLFQSVDILKTNQMWGGLIAVVAKLVYKKPLIVRCGYEWRRNLLRSQNSGLRKVNKSLSSYLIECITYHMADTIVVTSIENANYIRKYFFIRRRKIRLIRNFIDTDCFSPNGKEYGHNEYKDRILFIGRFDRVKNLFSLVKAIRKTAYGLDLIGSGELEGELRIMAKEINADVRFLGVFANDELPFHIVQYPIVVLPSFFENNPKSLLEAMACERIVIGTNVDGINEIINDRINGILSECDANSLVRAINKTMEEKEKLGYLGRNARKWVIDNCSLHNIYESEKKMYLSMVQ